MRMRYPATNVRQAGACLPIAGIVLALVTVTGACTVGEPDTVDAGRVIDQLGTNRPFRNGCTLDMTAWECAANKGILPQSVCAFRQRVRGAYFMIGTESLTPAWRWENLISLLPHYAEVWDDEGPKTVDVWALPLSESCEGPYTIETGRFTFIPDEEGCAQELGGIWNGQFCFSDAADVPIDGPLGDGSDDPPPEAAKQAPQN